MKKQRMIIIPVVAMMLVAVGIAIIISQSNNEEMDNSDYVKFWNPQVDKYVVYTNEDPEADWENWTMKTTVLSIEVDELLRNEVIRTSDGYVFVDVDWSAPINLTFGNGFDINHDMGHDVTVTEVGLENITTLWGERTCIRYHAVWGDGGEEDFWVHNGIMVKDVIPYTSMEGGTWILTSTNIPEVTHQ